MLCWPFSVSNTTAQVGVIFIQSLNHFQRYAFVRQAQEKETRKRRSFQLAPSNLAPPPQNNTNLHATLAKNPTIPTITLPLGRTHSDSVSYTKSSQANASETRGLTPTMDGPRRTSESGIAF